jgi:hypothetical protein
VVAEGLAAIILPYNGAGETVGRSTKMREKVGRESEAAVVVAAPAPTRRSERTVMSEAAMLGCVFVSQKSILSG